MVAGRRPPARGRRFACAKSGRGGTTHRKPQVLAPPSGEGRRHFAARPAPKYSRAADPLDVTAPSYPLLNFKPRAEEQPGGGGFLRSPRLLHAGDRHLPAPVFPALPKILRSSPADRPRARRSDGGVRGGGPRARATGAERAPARARPAPRSRRRRRGAATSAAGNPPPSGRRCPRPAGARLSPRSAPCSWLPYPGRATPGNPKREN